MPAAAPAPQSAPSAAERPWHACPAEDALAALDVDVSLGLTAAQAADRLSEHGPNRLDEPERRSALRRFFDQFKSLLVIILMVAAVVAGLVGDLKDVVVISFALVLNATLGYVQEGRAEKSMDAMRTMLAQQVRVRRDGHTQTVEVDDVVPGDVVMLEAGDRVPADGRLVEVVQLAVDEAGLTGESVPVDKSPEPVDADAAVADRTNLAFMQTTVTRGRGEMVVTGTGMGTEMGRVADLLASADPGQTPLQRQLHHLGQRLVIVAGLATTLVFVLAMVRGESLATALVEAVVLAVAAVPEGLPAVVTVTLAVGTAQMAKHRAIVRRLASVETLGSTRVICTDKTGTLTRNVMVPRTVWRDGEVTEVPGDEPTDVPPLDDVAHLEPVLRAAAWCTDASLRDGTAVGDPTEVALIALADAGGVDVAQARRAASRVAEIPFDSSRKYMATVNDTDSGPLLVVKGATEVLAPLLTAVATRDGGRRAVDEEGRATILRAVDELAHKGQRVLAIATRRLGADEVDRLDPDDPAAVVTDLELEALIGLFDPPRPEAAQAIALCKQAGISVKMITGDHAGTAEAIARQLGLDGEVVTGAQLDALDDDELTARIDGIAAVARVSPEHKVRIVTTLQRKGQTTAMTGDGVNDAAALKQADIGVAMGITGTEVTKEAGDLVLADDNFATIVTAVERGRAIADNIVNFVRFQLATSMGAIAVILGARLIGLPAPFSPVQILWVNIIMDGPPAMTLGVDPPKPGVMRRPPRPSDEQILSGGRLVRLVAAGLVMAVGTLGLFAWILTDTGGDEGRQLGVSMAFTTFVLFQFWNALNARVEHGTVFSRHTFTNGKLWLALGSVALLQVAVVQISPLASFFDTQPLSLAQWGVCLAVSSSILVTEELRKLVERILVRRR